MEENLLVKSQKQKYGKFYIAILFVGIILSLIMSILVINEYSSYYEGDLRTYNIHREQGYCYKETLFGVEFESYCDDCSELLKYNLNKITYVKTKLHVNDDYWPLLIPISSSLLLIATFYLYMEQRELTITNKGIQGKTIFRQKIVIPFDSVIEISANKLLKGITIATSSGKIRFRGIKNTIEIHSIMSEILDERKNEQISKEPFIKAETYISNADEIKKYKDLLDVGAITQAEFDAKKKDLLGL